MHLLQQKLEKYNVILGSQSPRRKELLNGLDIPFEVRVKDTDENYSDSLQITDIATFIAERKFKAFIHELHDNDFLITADTIVVKNNTIIHKPKNLDEALEMIQELSDSVHTVITGVCFGTKAKYEVFSDMSTVTFADIHNHDISYYVQKYKPLDKAGAYGVQEWIGYVGIKKIEGSYFNVMGLPVQALYTKILNFNI